jgi:hypothetical protein
LYNRGERRFRNDRLEDGDVAKNDELPPMGLPLEERSSSRYFLGLTAMIVACGALLFAVGYGSLQLSSGPCDELHDEALGGLRAEVEFLKESGSALGVNKVEIQELRSSTQVAGDSLEACCEQHAQGAIDAERFQECQQHATTMAALPAELIAAHGDPDAAKQAIRTAANRLRGMASDLTDIANPGEVATGVAAGPSSGTPSDD